MMSDNYAQNFEACELGDKRLTRRALSIGKALTQRFGQGLSTVFESARELNRAYEFSPIPKPSFQRSSPHTAR